MKEKYGGPISVDDLFQAIWRDRESFRKHGIEHVRGVVLYFTPCDAYGRPIVVRHKGERVGGYMSAGGYQCAAAAYEAGRLVPETVTVPCLPTLI